MGERTLKHAKAMHKYAENHTFVGDVIDQLDVDRTTFYRHCPPDRFKRLRSELA